MHQLVFDGSTQRILPEPTSIDAEVELFSHLSRRMALVETSVAHWEPLRILLGVEVARVVHPLDLLRLQLAEHLVLRLLNDRELTSFPLVVDHLDVEHLCRQALDGHQVGSPACLH